MQKEYFKSEIGESYLKAVLDNGLRVFILEKPQYRSSYVIYGTKYGSIDTCFSVDGKETAVPEGIAHFLEHKLFESEDGDAFTKYAATGAYSNAFTSFDRTCYLFSCTDRFSENLDILLNFVQSPYFTEETVKKEQGIIGQEIRMYDDDPNWRVMFNMLKSMYHRHPVRIDIAGTVESIAQIDHNLLYTCYNTFYNPANMYICVAGNVDTGEVLEQINRTVKKTQPVNLVRINANEPETVLNNEICENLEVAQPMFCFGIKEKIKTPERSYKERIITSLLIDIIAGEISPLYKRLTDEGLINDEFSTEHFCGYGYSSLVFDGESANPKKVAELIKSEIKRLKTDGIDKSLFAESRALSYGNSIRAFNTVEGIAMQFVDSAMGDYELFDEIEFLKTVTLDDITAKLLTIDEENSVLSVINPLRGEN